MNLDLFLALDSEMKKYEANNTRVSHHFSLPMIDGRLTMGRSDFGGCQGSSTKWLMVLRKRERSTGIWLARCRREDRWTCEEYEGR